MDLTRVILGPVVTEKAESAKAARKSYTLRVVPEATKVDVRGALEQFYGVEVESVRVMRVTPKVRLTARGPLRKRHPFKKALVTLSSKSKVLDLSTFKTS